jgi:hypothetical protein
MKKNYLFTILFTFPLISFSQITITENDVIDVSDVLEQGIDTSGTFIHPLSGSDMEWDFSALDEHLSETLAIGAAQWFDGSSEFPDANIATMDDDGNEIFIRKNSDALDLLGLYGDVFGSGDDEAVYFDPQNRIVSFPSTMGTSYTNTFSFSFVNYDIDNTDSVLIDITNEQNSEIDGWGEITTPFGTFDVIRQVVQEIQTTEVEAYLFGNVVFTNEEKDTTYTARYWSNDPSTGFPVVEYDFNMLDNSIQGSITWLKSSPVTAVGNEAIDLIELYPNPAIDQVTLTNTQKGQIIVVFDIVGNQIMTNDANSDISTFSVAVLKAGTYFVKVINREGDFLTSKKLIVK